ncbi:MAG: 30S ribosomal protein S17 [bacterium]|nr:30S ribosomal protein S17 [bacterium]
MDQQLKQSRRFQGVVISNAMEKTCVVRVERTKVHPKYRKAYRVKRNFKVHDPENEARVGAVVHFEECRPISKEKRWRLLRS